MAVGGSIKTQAKELELDVARPGGAIRGLQGRITKEFVAREVEAIAKEAEGQGRRSFELPAKQAIWAILRVSTGHALDYDVRAQDPGSMVEVVEDLD